MNSIHTALTAGAKFMQLFGEVTKLIEASPTVFNRDINFKLMLMKEQVEQLDRRSERLEKERDHWKRLAEQYQETILKENER